VVLRPSKRLLVVCICRSWTSCDSLRGAIIGKRTAVLRLHRRHDVAEGDEDIDAVVRASMGLSVYTWTKNRLCFHPPHPALSPICL